MPQKDNGAGKMDHPDEVLQRVFPAYREPAEILEPGEKTFYLPATAAATERASILRAILAVSSVRRDHLDAGLGEFFIEPVGIVRIVPNETL